MKVRKLEFIGQLEFPSTCENIYLDTKTGKLYQQRSSSFFEDIEEAERLRKTWQKEYGQPHIFGRVNNMAEGRVIVYMEVTSATVREWVTTITNSWQALLEEAKEEAN